MLVDARDQRLEYLARRKTLNDQREPHLRAVELIAEQVMPRRSFRFMRTRAKGKDNRRTDPQLNDKLVDTTPRDSQRTTSAGLMGGFTSPSRKWFRLSLSDPDLAQHHEARAWLEVAEQRLREILAKSNAYKAFHEMYEQTPIFGTGVLLVDEDDEDVVRFHVIEPGDYYLAASARGAVDTLYRDFSLTARAVVQKFGFEACSRTVQRLVEKRETWDTWVNLLHVIEPREPNVPARWNDPTSWPFRSCWLELDAGGEDVEDAGILREHGYHEQPVMGTRWHTIGESVYGNGLGHDVLATCRELQFVAGRHGLVTEKLADPPLMGPATLSHRRVSQLPGHYTPVPAGAQNQKIEPMVVVHPQALAAVREYRMWVAEQVKAGLFSNLFKQYPPMGQDGGREYTAAEIRAREQERMMLLGPAMERQEDELHDPCMFRVIACAMRAGRLPPLPEVMRNAGATLKIEYLSMLTTAQKLVDVAAIREAVAFAAEFSKYDPTIIDNIDGDAALRVLVDAVGAPSTILHTIAEVQAQRRQAAEAAERQRNVAEALAAAKTTQALGAASTQPGTALGDLARAYTPGGGLLQ